MKILIIEDDMNKARQIRELLRQRIQGAEIKERHSYQSGLKEALIGRPDVVVLDMTMQTYDAAGDMGGRMRPYAGREILGELARRGVKTRAVIVTQFENFFDKDETVSLEQLSNSLEHDYPEYYVDTIYYAAAEAQWKDRLAAAVQESGGS